MDENTKDLLLSVIAAVSGVGGAVIGALLANRSAREREDAEREYRERETAVRHIRERRTSMLPEKIAALRSAKRALDALAGHVDEAIAGRTQDWETTLDQFYAQTEEFDLLFSSDLANRRAEATQAMLAKLELVQRGVQREDPSWSDAERRARELRAKWLVAAKSEIGLEPTKETSLRSERTEPRHT